MPNIRPTPTILLPRLPAKTLVGLDLLSFTSTEQFYGVSDLTPGWHFLYTGTTESFSIRCGAWFYVGDIPHGSTGDSNNDSNNSIILHSGTAPSGPEIRIWRWSQDTETLVPMRGDNDENRLEIMRWKANLGGLRQMGALFSYKTKGLPENTEIDEDDVTDQPMRRDWIQLTNRLTPEILSRVLGTPFADEDERPSWSINSASTAARDADNIPGITAEMASEVRTKTFGGGGGGQDSDKEKELQFLPIDLKRTWREGAIGRERTEAAQDKSWALGDLIGRYSSPDNEKKGEGEILGELQFCFLMILTLMNYSCLEQWKRLLSLILTCRTAIREREPFFRDVLQLLRLQLRHCEDVDGGLFEMDGDYDGNFLRKLLTEFRQTIHQLEDGVGNLVRPEMNALEQWVRTEYGWELRKDSIMRRGMLQLEDGEQVEMVMSGADEDDETGEYAPVIVDMGGNEVDDTTDADTPMD